ncbi:MAG: hypothetical protein ACJ8ER_12760 [Allosphingosinicella sp.]
MRPGGIALAAVLLAAAAPAAAQPPLSAERAIEVQREGLRESVGTAPCPRGANGEDIVVCGRRGADPNRLPLPVEPLPGEREHLLPGELPRAQASFSTCVIACEPHGIQVNPILVFKVGRKIVRHILGEDD